MKILSLSKHGILASVVCFALCTGCASNKTQQPQPSGFLGDPSVYESMKPDPTLVGVQIYKSDPYPLAGYDSFIVPPVSIYLNAEGRKRGIPVEDLTNLARQFREAVIKDLGSRYQVVDVPAARVAILRMAITDANPNTALLNVVPGTDAGLGGASIEVDLLDSSTGRRVIAVMASGTGSGYANGLTTWGSAEQVLNNWARIIGERINSAHG